MAKKKNIKILCIHMGMLEKAYKQDNIQEWQKWIDDVRKLVPFVVIESDRGEGSFTDLPEHVRFLQFSAIEPWFEDIKRIDK